MRCIPDTMDAVVVAHIDARLDGVERDHGVRIGWAIESGSRAWGFPSPDSDYDCRFVYLRPATDYLTPWLPRDVIETPLDAVYDVNGWDLRKAVALMADGNATLLEWLRSPIVYRGDDELRTLLLDLASRIGEPELVARHYAHLGRRQWERLGAADPDASVKLKGLLYALRPAAALFWMRAHPGDAVPPMRLQDLLAETEPPAALESAVQELIELKSRTRELGSGPIPPPVRDFVVAQLFADDLDGTGRRHLDASVTRALATEAFRTALS